MTFDHLKSFLMLLLIILLQVVGELWRPAGGAYNVDSVLKTMVRGLEKELEVRRSGLPIYTAALQRPSVERMSPSSTPNIRSSNQSQREIDSWE
jgi:hypothetical protein